MKTILSSILIAMTATLSSAQQIHFCLSYTVLGEPMRVSNSWNIGDDGGYLYILYKQQEEIQRNKYSMVVSEERDGKFVEVNRHRIIPEAGKNWVAVYHKFFKGGDFKISMLDNDRVIASEYFTIVEKKTKVFGKRRFKDPRFIYANTKVIACETVRDGKAVNPSAVFCITKESSQVTFVILNDKTMDTEKLNIDIYRKSMPFGEYSEFVESKRVKIQHDQNNSYFSLQFIEPGEYKVYIYDQDQIWINSGYVTINSK